MLQDVHWSDSNFGYLRSYAIGNVISVQLWGQATSELGNVNGEFGRVRLSPRVARERVHRWGRVFEPGELLERAVGGPLDSEPYLAYLREKVTALES